MRGRTIWEKKCTGRERHSVQRVGHKARGEGREREKGKMNG